MRIQQVAMCAIALFAAATAATAARAADIQVNCDVHSDYDFALTDKSVVFTRKTGEPKTVLMRQGRLFVDDRWVAVSDADRDRLVRYEREARATMPLAQRIGRDAADIAFTALGEVAKELSDDPARTDARLKQARVELDRSLASSINPSHFDSERMGRGISEAVGKVVPMVVGDIVGGALRAAFSGDDARLGRLDDLDGRIDAIVEPRSKALERNARELCTRMRALDAIDDSLDYRHDGSPLALLRVEAGRGDADHD